MENTFPESYYKGPESLPVQESLQQKIENFLKRLEELLRLRG